MLLKKVIDKAQSVVSEIYTEREARVLVFRCLEDMFGISRHKHILDPSYELPEDIRMALEEVSFRLASGEPLQYITGRADFYGRVFKVNPSVLIPRQETEILCRKAIAALKGRPAGMRVLDLCTGSGCIAWTLALECPGAKVTAVDISDGALQTASSQDFSQEIDRSGALAPSFVKADVLDITGKEGLMPAPDFRWDVIVSNPPYVMESEKSLMKSDVLNHEPHLALFVPDEDPLKFYRAVADWASGSLAEDGFGMVEINEAFGEETAAVFIEAGFADVRVMKDLNDRDRFVCFSRKV